MGGIFKKKINFTAMVNGFVLIKKKTIIELQKFALQSSV